MKSDLINISILALLVFVNNFSFAETAPPTATCTATTTPINVDPARELLIRDLSVVNDPIRTVGCGAWTFCNLMKKMAGSKNPGIFVRNWLAMWEIDRTINGFVVPKRPSILNDLVNRWPKNANGTLNLEKSPFRLLAIVNRIDQRNTTHAGEARFVFGLLDGDGGSLQMTVIFEYKMWNAVQSTENWANDWHSLGTKAFGATYNNALEAVTNKFVNPNALIRNLPNSSSISQVRTNEIVFSAPWELREFVISPTSRDLVQTTVKLNPDKSFNGTTSLKKYINTNAAAILVGTNNISWPLKLGGASENNFDTWDAQGILNPEARFKFALNTCNGCHGIETATTFLHINPRPANAKAAISDFFENVTVTDGLGMPRNFNELARRRLNFEAFLTLLTPAAAAPSLAAASGSAPIIVLPETNLTAEEQLELTKTNPNAVH